MPHSLIQSSETAGLLAVHASAIVRHSGGHRQFSEHTTQNLWVQSRCRLSQWMRSLNDWESWLDDRTGLVDQANASRLQLTLAEILVTELLTRIWVPMACALEPNKQAPELEPVAHSVWMGHQGARRRCLQLLINYHSRMPVVVTHLNHLRTSVERWNDMLLGFLLIDERHPIDVTPYAFDLRRAQDAGDDYRDEHQAYGRLVTWPLTLASMRSSIWAATESEATAPNQQLNLAIAAAAISSFQPDLFESTGRFHALWQSRLTHLASDTGALLQQLAE